MRSRIRNIFIRIACFSLFYAPDADDLEVVFSWCLARRNKKLCDTPTWKIPFSTQLQELHKSVQCFTHQLPSGFVAVTVDDTLALRLSGDFGAFEIL